MWAKLDEMAQMMREKSAHLEAGANCAWIPSPTAATLHSMHYHDLNVTSIQTEISNRPLTDLDDILAPPLLKDLQLTADDVQAELENNIQGILGYVVRWVDQGIGCSKVLDISNVELMEDRATLRISSQHVANWLRHNICSENQVIETLRRMAAIIDKQNLGDTEYQNMAPEFDQNISFRTAKPLIFDGCAEPNGYTEATLNTHRREFKQNAVT